MFFIALCSFIVPSDLIDELKSKNKANQLNKKNHHSPFFTVYHKYISPTDGDRCPMYPSCSVYSEYVIKHCGLTKGIIMTTDRLARCGNDLHLYNSTIMNKRILYENFPPPVFKTKNE